MDESKDLKIRLMPKRYKPQLGALLVDTAPPVGEREIVTDLSLSRDRFQGKTSGSELSFLSPDRIRPSRYQFREVISDIELDELAASIKEKGILQPIIVRPLEESNAAQDYELVAGERRLRAAMRAGLEILPAVVRILSEREALEIAIIENAQRENLNPVEEALSYQRLVDEFDTNHSEIAKAVGKNRATISNALRLLQLEPEVLELLRTGVLHSGHGRALLAVDAPETQLALARKVERQGLSVRALEELIRELGEEGQTNKKETIEELVSLKRAESKLRTLLNIEKINLRLDAQGRKRLQITFESEAAWKRFLTTIRD